MPALASGPSTKQDGGTHLRCLFHAAAIAAGKNLVSGDGAAERNVSRIG